MEVAYSADKGGLVWAQPAPKSITVKVYGGSNSSIGEEPIELLLDADNPVFTYTNRPSDHALAIEGFGEISYIGGGYYPKKLKGVDDPTCSIVLTSSDLDDALEASFEEIFFRNPECTSFEIEWERCWSAFSLYAAGGKLDYADSLNSYISNKWEGDKTDFANQPLPTPVREGYEFKGWFCDGNQVFTYPEFFGHGLVNYVAQWEKAEKDPVQNGDLWALMHDESGNPIQATLEEGSYVLNRDVEDGISLLIESEGNYSIDLQGHTVSFVGNPDNPRSAGFDVSSKATEEINIVLTSSTGRGALEFIDCGQLTATGNVCVAMENVDISKSYTRANAISVFEHGNLVSQAAIDIRDSGVLGQSVDLTNCSVTVNYGNQTMGSADKMLSTGTNSVTALKIASQRLNSAKIENTTVKALAGTPAGTFEYDTAVDAVAMYVRASGTNEQSGIIDITGSTFIATAPKGSAYGILCQSTGDKRAQLRFSDEENVLQANGMGSEALSIGVLQSDVLKSSDTTSSRPVLLNSPIAFTSESAGKVFALASDSVQAKATDAPFEVGGSFESQAQLPVAIGLRYSKLDNTVSTSGIVRPISIAGDANGNNVYVASFAEGLSDDDKARVCSLISEGTGANSIVANAGDGVKFVDESKDNSVVCRIVRDGEELDFTSFSEASKDLRDGETLIVLRDTVGVLEFQKTDEELADIEQAEKDAAAAEGAEGADASEIPSRTYTVDLQGHSAGGFANASNATINVVSTGNAAKLSGQGVGGQDGAITQTGEGSLFVDNVVVDVDYIASCGVVVKSGSAVLKDCQVDVMNDVASPLYGIYVADGCALTTIGGSVTVDNAHGVATAVCAMGDSTVAIEETNLAAQGTGTVCVVDGHNANVSVVSANGKPLSLDASASENAADVELFGINVEGSSTVNVSQASFSLDGSGVDVAEGKVQGFGLSATGSSAYPAVLLDGDISFAQKGMGSYADIRHQKNPLLIGDAFKVDAAATVLSSLLDADAVFASAATDGGSLSEGQAAFFAASDLSGTYAGYAPKVLDGKLAWTADKKIEIVDADGVSYDASSLASALLKAKAMNKPTLKLVVDVQSAPVVISEADVTIDLNGRSLVIGSETEAKAVRVSNDSSLTLVDNLGSAPAVSLVTGGNGGQGVGIAADGDVMVDGVSVELDCSKGSYSKSSVAVISASDNANISIKNGAKLTVDTSKAASSDGVDAYGIYGIAHTGSVSIDETSSVYVNVVGEAVEMDGAYGDTGGAGLNSSLRHLREFNPSEDDAFYKRICEEFRVNAKLDSSASSSVPNSVYGSQMYYVAPMNVDGKLVWAFSMPVKEADRGSDEAKVPAVIYLDTKYEAVPTAYGIYDAGSANVNGAVSVTSQSGDAFAVVNGEKSVTTVADGAVLTASSNGTTAHITEGDTPDLRKRLGVSCSMEPYGFFPKDTHVKLVESSLPVAGAIDAAEGSLVLQGACSLNAAAASGNEYDIRAESFEVDPSFKATSVVRVLSPDDAPAEGAAFATLPKAAEGEASSETLNAAHRDMFSDASHTLLPVLSSNGAALSWGKRYAVHFNGAWGELDAYGQTVTEGYELTVPTSSAMVLPGEETNGKYELVGWSLDPNAKEGDEGIVAPGGSCTFVPSAGDAKDVNYYAIFRFVPKTYTVKFTGARDESGKVVADTSMKLEAGQALGSEWATVALEPTNSGTQVFVGWKTTVPRKGSDTGTMNAVVAPDCMGDFVPTADTTFTAYYVNVPEGCQLVIFRVDDCLYPIAVEFGALPSYKDALLAVVASEAVANSPTLATPTRDVDDEGHVYEWFGWLDESGALLGTTDDSLARAQAGDSVTYTADFRLGDMKTGKVKLFYYRETSSGKWELDYSALAGKEVELPYGTQLNSDEGLARLKEKEVDIKGFVKAEGTGSNVTYYSYTFAGWSLDPTDKQSMGDLLPKVGYFSDSNNLMGGTTGKCYAIYDKKVMDVVVTLADENGTVLASVTVPCGTTLKDLAQSDEFKKIVPTGKELDGFSRELSGSQISRADLCYIGTDSGAVTFMPQDGDGATTAAATYYAKFRDTSELDKIKKDAQSQLETLYDTYEKDSYSSESWEKLTSIYNEAVQNVGSATTADEVLKAASDAAAAMSAVAQDQLKSEAGKVDAQAQENAKKVLQSAYASYNSADYSVQNWAELTAAYNRALQAIGDATTTDDVFAQLSAGIANMKAVPTLPTSTTSEGSDSNTSTGAETGAGQSSSGLGSSGLSNSGLSGSGLSSGSGSSGLSSSGLSSSSSGIGHSESGLSGADLEGGELSDEEAAALADELNSSILLDDENPLASGAESQEGVASWLGSHIPIVCLIVLLVLGAVSAGLWFFLKKRSESDGDDDDFFEEDLDDPLTLAMA